MRVLGSGLVRRGASTALDTVGRVAIAAAQRVDPVDGSAGSVVPRLLPGLRTSGPTDGRADARTADIADLRRLALEVTLAAANDPRRSAYDRLTSVTVNLSEWAAGRLLGEAERMRQAAVAVVAAGSDEGRLLTRRQFDLALRRQFPWADDVSTDRLFEQGVLVAHRIRDDATQAEPNGSRGLLGGLVGRLRLRG